MATNRTLCLLERENRKSHSPENSQCKPDLQPMNRKMFDGSTNVICNRPHYINSKLPNITGKKTMHAMQVTHSQQSGRNFGFCSYIMYYIIHLLGCLGTADEAL
jgi:hypothetical protein